MLKQLSYFVILLTSISILSCTSDSESDLLEPIEEEIFISYNENIKNIIDNNCIACHNNPPINGAPMSLITYSNVKDAIQNRNLIERISNNNLGSLMPLGGTQLPQNIVDTIKQWETEGFLEQ